MQARTIKHLEKIDQLISMRVTGNASELANKLGISRANTYQYINLMKHFGAPIKYNDEEKTYYYDIDGKFLAGFHKN